jgi:hypothetical protein
MRKNPLFPAHSRISWRPRPNAGMTSEGSNFHIPECKKPFEMSLEFPEFCWNIGLETFAPASCALEIRSRLRSIALSGDLSRSGLLRAEPPMRPLHCTGCRGASAGLATSILTSANLLPVSRTDLSRLLLHVSLFPTVPVAGTSSIAPTFAGRSPSLLGTLCRDSEQRQKHDTARHKKCADRPDDPEAFFHDEDAD